MEEWWPAKKMWTISARIRKTGSRPTDLSSNRLKQNVKSYLLLDFFVCDTTLACHVNNSPKRNWNEEMIAILVRFVI